MSSKSMFLGVATAVLLIAGGCKPSTPDDIISKGKMEDILHDYHLAQVMADKNGDRAIDQRTYTDAIFRKYDVTKAEFDSSLAYYMRHTEELHKIYENIADRYKEEAEELGASVAEISKYDALTATGDTANVWVGAHSLVLTPIAPLNQYSFVQQADTAYHAGDKLILDFDACFIYQDGIRSGAALLAIKFANDSVASTNVQLSGSSHFSLTLSDNDHLGIKEVKGYFLLNRSQSADESQTTLKLMFVNNIRLIRMHETKKEKDERRRNDSIQKANQKQLPAQNLANTPIDSLPVPKAAGTPIERIKPRQLPVKNASGKGKTK